MCPAIYVAAALVALIAGLTLLRVREPHSPGADLLAQALDGLGKDTPPLCQATPGNACLRSGNNAPVTRPLLSRFLPPNAPR